MSSDRHVHVVYDSASGEVVGTHSRYDPERGVVPAPEEEVDQVVALYARQMPERKLQAVAGRVAAEADAASLWVDPATRRILARGSLRVTAERTELEGDGKDAVELRIEALDASGKPAGDFDGELTVYTSHGRLSERGGRLRVKGGGGRLQLTSAPQTAAAVQVVVTDRSGRLRPGRVTLAFL